MSLQAYRARVRALLLTAALLGLASPGFTQSCETFRVLVFSKTSGFRHGSQINAGINLIQSLGAANNFAVDTTEDSAQFTTNNLAQYAAVIFLNTTGNVLDPAQEIAFEGYIMSGGGFVGVHSATDTEYGWPFYGMLVGAYFQNHPSIQNASLTVVDPSHPSTSTLPTTFTHNDEWYNFSSNPSNNPQIQVLMTIDESTYSGGNMGNPHPISWYQDLPGQRRSWYTALGHTTSTYSAPFFRDHLLGGILFAAGGLRTFTLCGSQTYGAASGTPALSLSWSPSATVGNVNVTSGDPGASGSLFFSECSASISSPPLTVLIDVLPPNAPRCGDPLHL